MIKIKFNAEECTRTTLMISRITNKYILDIKGIKQTRTKFLLNNLRFIEMLATNYH